MDEHTHNCILDIPYPEVTVCGKNPRYAALLTEDYAGQTSELTAITTYLFQHFICTDEKISETLRCIAGVEMRHMGFLGELISKLGGCPRIGVQTGCNVRFWSGQYLCYDTNPRRFLKQNIAAERAAIADYRKRIDQICDRYVREVLERIILDEEHHIMLFMELYEGLC